MPITVGRASDTRERAMRDVNIINRLCPCFACRIGQRLGVASGGQSITESLENIADCIERYRQRAAEMLRLAEGADYADVVTGYRGLAKCWQRLVDDIEQRKEACDSMGGMRAPDAIARG
jgi:hypothetical protein